MNEITYTSQILLRNGNLQDNFASGSIAATQSSAYLVRNVQNISTAAGGDALILGDVATPGFAVFQNLGTNFVEIGSNVTATFYPFLKLKPGEVQVGRIGIAAPYARADTLAVDLFYIIYND